MNAESKSPIDDTVRTEILRRLEAAEIEHDVRILYAVESGSRAWGFASPDSDFDVRFIYAHDNSWYLSFDIERKRDVIEYPIVDEIDCSGWDVKKALYLFTRTNGALLEWLNSPIKYLERGHFAERLRTLAPKELNSIALCYHYSHMARGNAREYLFKDKVRLKKYFYVLRPLLAIRYIEQGLGVPPVEFDKLVDAVAPENIWPGIAKLLAEKKKTSEMGYGEPILEINDFIGSELERHGDEFKGQGRPDLLTKKDLRDELNSVFQEAVSEDGRSAI
jgi:predicted nucleotidyltransferase